jgi:hypothetical protein
VCPIKQGIVNYKTDKKADRQIVERVRERIPINAGHPRFVHLVQPSRHDGENQYRLYRHSDFSLNILSRGTPVLDSTFFLLFVRVQEIVVVSMPTGQEIAKNENEEKDYRELYDDHSE